MKENPLRWHFSAATTATLLRASVSLNRYKKKNVYKIYNTSKSQTIVLKSRRCCIYLSCFSPCCFIASWYKLVQKQLCNILVGFTAAFFLRKLDCNPALKKIPFTCVIWILCWDLNKRYKFLWLGRGLDEIYTYFDKLYTLTYILHKTWTHLDWHSIRSSSISTAGWSLLWLGCCRCLMETKKEKHIQVKITATQKATQFYYQNYCHFNAWTKCMNISSGKYSWSDS